MTVTVRLATEDELPALAAFGAELDLSAPTWRCNPLVANPDLDLLTRLAGAAHLVRADTETDLVGFAAVLDSGEIKWLVMAPDTFPEATTALFAWMAANYPAVTGRVTNPDVVTAIVDTGAVLADDQSLTWTAPDG